MPYGCYTVEASARPSHVWAECALHRDMNTTTNTTLTVFYNDEYVNPNDAETRTKAEPLARMIEQGEVPGVTLKSPQSVTPTVSCKHFGKHRWRNRGT